MKSLSTHIQESLNEAAPLAAAAVGVAVNKLSESKKSFKNTKDFEKFLIEIDSMKESDIREIMGDEYIDTPGNYKEEKKDYDDIFDYMKSNMGKKEFELLEQYWLTNIKK